MMTDQELVEARQRRWRIDSPERGLRTIDDARGFLNQVGFCLLYPVLPPVLSPTWMGAWLGSERGLPLRRQALVDPRVKVPTELFVRMLREKSAFEAPFGEADTTLVISKAEFPYLYALLGDKNPKRLPESGLRQERQLQRVAFEAIQKKGPIPKRKLLEYMRKESSEAALDRALQALWSEMRIARVDYGEEDGLVWDVIYRWAPDAVKASLAYSRGEALSALISRYLETTIAAGQREIEDFFGHFAAKSKVTEVIKALINAREFQFITVGERTLVHLRPEVEPVEKSEPRPPRPPRPQRPVKRSFRPGPGARPGSEKPAAEREKTKPAKKPVKAGSIRDMERKKP